MRKFRAVMAIVLTAGVMSVGTTACTTQPRTPEEQVRFEEWVRTSLGGIVGLWFWNWYNQTFPCPYCV